MTRDSSQEAPDPAQLTALVHCRVGELGLSLDGRQLEQLVALARLMANWGRRINLSGHRSATEIVERLIIDALAMAAAIRDLVDEWPNRIVDLGSGAGIPGLPLAIAFTETSVELIEARERRHHFQRAACRELEIPNAVPRLGRIEQLAALPAPLVVARAVGPIQDVTALAERWLMPSGWLVVPSGPTPPRFDPGPSWIAHGTRPYSAPGLAGTARSIWFARRAIKVSESP